MKQKRQRKTLILAALLCVVMLAAAGCGTKQQSSQGGQNTEPSSAAVSAESAEKQPAEDTKDQTAGSGHTCKVSIDCTDILEHKDQLKEEKAEFLPEDGWILKETEEDFTPGETAFDVIKRICEEKKINVSVRDASGSAYIEGINQIYEFDCGDASGWMYTVNGELPNYSYSEYEVQDQDKIVLFYVCDMNDYFAE